MRASSLVDFPCLGRFNLLLLSDDLLQHAADTLASETGIHLQSQALPRAGIDLVQCAINDA